MADYANAAPSPSALFDNTPAAPPRPAYFREPPDTLTPATRIAQARDGKWYALPVVMQYGLPLPLGLALKRVAIGRTVFVAPGDADAVLCAARGQVGETQVDAV